jgi:hypothetical protein
MYEDADFSGYATKTGIRCSDGRTITDEAFQHQDTVKVPLVWQHDHDDPSNVLGHVFLEHRDVSHPSGAGTYCYGFFNESEQGKSTKALVQHGDISALSIYANQLREKVKNGFKEVVHGVIREVSLVLSGANPGALIENVRLAHGNDEYETLEDEAVIYTGLELEHSDKSSTDVVEPDKKEKTVQDVLDTLNDEQKLAVNFILGEAIEDAATAKVEHSATSEEESTENSEDTESEEIQEPEDAPSDGDSGGETPPETPEDTNTEGDLNHQEGSDTMSNVFDGNGIEVKERKRLTHSQLETIMTDAKKSGETLKSAFLAHAEEYGFGDDIDILFPDAKAVTSQPDLITRRTEWVAGVIDGAKHSPFARIKSTAADVTAEEARARGYVKGNKKKDEVVRLLKRVTTPTTIYKKQKLDRDDIVDITDLDVVAWLKWEMRFMLEEELARAILIGDGREPDDDDKINEDNLRPIAYDDDMYSHKVTVPSNSTPEAIVEAIIRARKNYKGTGRPAFYTTDDIITDLLLIKDKLNRDMYADEDALAKKLRVSSLVAVEVMETEPDIIGIMVNISDYTIGADKGGQLSMFDDFDIDYNQFKYLIETRVSGALTKPKSAVVVRRASGTTVTPQMPNFTAATNKLVIPTQTGVDYYDVTDIENETSLTDGETYYVSSTVDIEARPSDNYSFPHNTDNDWTFAHNAGGAGNTDTDPTLPS